MTAKAAHSEILQPLVNDADMHATAWHSCAEDAVAQKLVAGYDGLDLRQIEHRLQEFGKNMLPEPQPPTLLQIIFHQFKSPLIYLLMIAGFVALFLKEYTDAGFIFTVILLNAAIGTFQEYRAEQKAHGLKALLKIQARVKRSGRRQTIPAEELVPGDIVFVESGDKVPADIRLFQVNNLTIDESFLTGESLPVEKNTTELDEETPVSDRQNMAFAGATVITGRGSGFVVATGFRTQVGQISKFLADTEGAKPPLLIRMERFSGQISIIVLVFATILGSLAVYRGMPFTEVFFLMVAMVVSAIPEGLPVAMTVALSIATSRMAKRNVIVRKLMAVESLGSCTTIASDKTGTLSVNQQTVKRILFPEDEVVVFSGQGYNADGDMSIEDSKGHDQSVENRMRDIATVAILCNEASLTREGDVWSHSGDAMDISLLAMSHKLKIDPQEYRQRFPLISQIPYESENRYAAVSYRDDRSSRIAIKGALETILPFCKTMRTSRGDTEIDPEKIKQQAQHLAEEGYRVLAFATRELPPDGENIEVLKEKHLQDLTMLGLVGFIDPLRPEAKQAVQESLDAGVRVIMITGDHPATALAIAKQLGFATSTEDILTGQDLEEMKARNTPEFFEKLRHTSVFARVTPEQKLRIVDGLVTMGEFVAVTGDGVNDAPALRRANIGVAMGSGSDIAKETASITIVDDNFASIVAGIEEGRYAYANVRKVTMLLISTGSAELVLLGLAVLMGLPLPLLAVQILWLNLVTNGIQDVALAFEAGEKGVMKRKPRKTTEGIFNRPMIEQVLVSGLTMAIVCLAAWITMMSLDMQVDEARNLLFTLLVLMQFYHVFNCRSEYLSAFAIPFRNNPILIIGTLIAFLIHIVAIYNPFMQSLLRTAPISLQQWLVLGLLAGSVMLVMEIYKSRRVYSQG